MSPLDRRVFLKYGCASTALCLPFLTGCGTSTASSSSSTQQKAIVHLLLDGGNDSFNMLVPTSTEAYNEYQTSRSNLALTKNTLLALDNFRDKNNKTFGLHPKLAELKELFTQKKLAFIANVGPLTKPVDKASFSSKSVPLPLGLMSHADQVRHWQSSRPDLRTNLGWGGAIADRLATQNNLQTISMNISLAGNNIFQYGMREKEYSINQNGSVGIEILKQNDELSRSLYNGFIKMLNKSHNDSFKQIYTSVLKQAQSSHELFNSAIDKITINTSFSNTELSQQLKMVAKAIAGRNFLGQKKQIFFVRYYGWDHHADLAKKHPLMLEVLSKAVGEFYAALGELNLENDVVLFTSSDFGRTLSSNGNGSDHGWGGNSFVVGGSVKGREIYGEYPSLALGSSLDIGGGVLIPTLSTDTYFSELASWLGLSQAQVNTVFPNLQNFSTKKLGFLV